jgi:DNA-3-methyladenine glycosylase
VEPVLTHAMPASPASPASPGSAGPPGSHDSPGSAGSPAPSAFYDRPVLAVARDLLGATVRHGTVAVRLTEVEAYGGPDDPASHGYRGRTRRNAAMFGPPGCAYVYFVYGMHWCLNVVCGPPGQALAVLLRAGEVECGLEQARARAPRLADRQLASGPGRLARALGVDGHLDGVDVTGSGPLTILLPLTVLLPPPAAPPLLPPLSPSIPPPVFSAPSQRGQQPPATAAPALVSRGPRVGVSRGEDLLWRLWLDGEPTVSRPRDAGAPGLRSSHSRRRRRGDSSSM